MSSTKASTAGSLALFLRAKGHSIELVFEALWPSLKKSTFSVKKVQLPEESSSLFGILKNIAEALRHSTDVYHITGHDHYLSLFLNRQRTILTIHDCGFSNHPNRLKRRLLTQFWLKRPVKRLKYITAVSEKTKEEIVALTGLSGQRVIVIPNPHHPALTYCPHEFNAACPLILQVGTKANKNIERVAEALQDLPCRLLIIGQLNERQRSVLLQCQINFETKCDLPYAQMIEAYRAADLVVFASTYEGFGLPIIESQVVGRPVVTSDLSPLREVAGPGACLIDPYDPDSIRAAVIRIIDDSGFRENLVRRGRQNARRFAPERIAQAYLSLYRKVVEEQLFH